MRLGLAVGRVDIDAMLSEISSEQFTEWKAYELLEPFGPLAEEWRFANQTSVIANAYRNTKIKSQPFVAKDFMRNFEERLLKSDDELFDHSTLENRLMVAMKAFGGTDVFGC